MMAEQLHRNWWLVALRGVLAIVFGVLAFIWPGITLMVLVLLFGAYALVDGIFAVIAALTNHAGANRGWVLLEGVAGIIAGILTFVWPGITAIVLLFVIGAWAIVTGVLEIIAAIQLRREISNEWLLILGGILSVLFGLYIVIFPRLGALSVVWLIAAYAIIFGIVFLVLGLRLRSWTGESKPMTPSSVG